MTVNEDSISEGDEFATDKRMKKTLLIETITKECTSSTHDILQRIHAAIGEGFKLEATVLSGGLTNYSYKVYVDKQPELCVFAKLSFEYALWNPDKTSHYDLQRTVNEYEIMVTSNNTSPDSVVKPLAILTLKHNEQNMKCLITEWAKADEQFCNQFIEGSVDKRIAPKLAQTLASLNLIEDFDPSFNETVKPCMENLMENVMRPSALAASKSDSMPKDRTEAYCKELGEDIVKVIDASIADYHVRECLVHADSHVFNTLVEAKPSIDLLEEFAPHGLVVLCDWEMAMAGPIGQDIGKALSFPISSLICFGLNGQSESNESIEVYIKDLIDSYMALMVEAGKSPEELAKIMRKIAGWCGWFNYLAMYLLNVHTPNLPIEEGKEGRLLDAVGIIGLKMLRLCYDFAYLPESAGVDEVRKVFDTLIEEEVTRAQDNFASFRRKANRRKSSMLRATGRRVSDTTGMLMHAAESVRNLSLSTLENGK